MTKRYYPEKFNTVTSADEAAMILDIERIPGESLFDYKKRVLEASSKAANSSYGGLINGINRELGLKQSELINISFKNILVGDLLNSMTTYSGYILSDSRLYQGIIDGTLTKIIGNKLISHEHLWEENILAGLTVEIDEVEYQVTGNTYNSVILDREPTSLHINKSYSIRAKWKSNSFIGYVFNLEKERYIVTSNTESTITLNKPIVFRQDGKFSLSLSRPRIEITASRIIFYIEYLSKENYRIDMSVDLREKSLTHRDLCKLVNSTSKYFQMEDLIPLDNPVRAFTFRHKDSDIKVFQEQIPVSKFFKLKNKNIKPDTLKFSEPYIFSKEEDILETELTGPYYTVNHTQGIVKTVLLPSGSGLVSYTYMDFPFVVESAPVVVLGLADKESEQFLFSQKEKIIYEDSRDRFVSGQPKTEMIEYVSELLKVNKQSWGI